MPAKLRPQIDQALKTADPPGWTWVASARRYRQRLSKTATVAVQVWTQIASYAPHRAQVEISYVITDTRFAAAWAEVFGTPWPTTYFHRIDMGDRFNRPELWVVLDGRADQAPRAAEVVRPDALGQRMTALVPQVDAAMRAEIPLEAPNDPIAAALHQTGPMATVVSGLAMVLLGDTDAFEAHHRATAAQDPTNRAWAKRQADLDQIQAAIPRIKPV